jgi:hypothetical protein
MAKNTIKLLCFGEDIIKNFVANAALKPGHILEQTTADKVKKHATAGGNVAPVMVALENSLEGEDIDDDYAADDQVRCWIPRAGDEGYLWLADGQEVSKHDLLESDGNGRLQKHTADKESWESGSAQLPGSITVYPKQIVCEALEAKDLLASAGSLGSEVESSGITGHQRIKVRFV